MPMSSASEARNPGIPEDTPPLEEFSPPGAGLQPCWRDHDARRNRLSRPSPESTTVHAAVDWSDIDGIGIGGLQSTSPGAPPPAKKHPFSRPMTAKSADAMNPEPAGTE